VKPYWEGRGVRLFLGDCREVLPTLPRGVAVLLTDPPYASGARRDAERQVRGSMLREFADAEWFSHDAMTTWGFTWFLRGVLTATKAALLPGAHLYVFTDWRQQPNVYGMLEATGYRVNQSLVWDKRHYGMGAFWRNQHEHVVFASLGTALPMRDRGAGSVLTCPTVSPAARRHPTQKPLPLLERILSVAPGGLVLDPFAGVGSTLLAAAALGQPAIGCEIEERWAEIAARFLDALPLPLLEVGA
jgi:site-specific DNA-methyltransferase (adenine-specific)